jgi:hypothetical protein
MASLAPSALDRAFLLGGVLLSVGLLGLAAVAFAAPAGPVPAAPAVAKDVELAWQRYWKNYARRTVRLQDLYFTCATFDSQYPSSRGITTVALRQKTTREVTEQKANTKVKKNLVRPNDDLDPFARCLPDAVAGNYGYIHSAQIVDILGPDEMVIAGIWLVSPEQVQAEREKEKEKLLKAGVEKGDVSDIVEWMFEHRDQLLMKQREKPFRQAFKLRGFSTVGLAKGERWTGRSTDKDGVQIAIVGEEAVEQKTKTRRPVMLPVVIPADSFMKGIAEEKEFLAFLTARGFTKEMFVMLVQEEKKINGTDEKLADAHIYAKLDGRTDEKKDEKTAPAKDRTKPSF